MAINPLCSSIHPSFFPSFLPAFINIYQPTTAHSNQHTQTDKTLSTSWGLIWLSISALGGGGHMGGTYGCPESSVNSDMTSPIYNTRDSQIHLIMTLVNIEAKRSRATHFFLSRFIYLFFPLIFFLFFFFGIFYIFISFFIAHP